MQPTPKIQVQFVGVFVAAVGGSTSHRGTLRCVACVVGGEIFVNSHYFKTVFLKYKMANGHLAIRKLKEFVPNIKVFEFKPLKTLIYSANSLKIVRFNNFVFEFLVFVLLDCKKIGIL